MVIYSQIQHPIPKGEHAFQDICLALLRLEWNDPYATLHGRSGQGQQGVDISGSDKRGNFAVAGCQCKGSEKNTPRKLKDREIDVEVGRAKKYKPPLHLLIIAYAGERDAPLQAKVREINDAHKKAGKFEVHLWAWDDIVDRAEAYPEMRALMYIQDGYLEEILVLDPKRTQAPAAFNSVTVSRSITVGRVGPLFDTTTSDEPKDQIAEAKIDVWRDQINAGYASTVLDSLKEFVSGFSSETLANVVFRGYANYGAALDQCGNYDEALAAYKLAADAKPGTAENHAYTARILLAKNEPAAAYVEASSALLLDPSQRLAAAILVQCAPPEIRAVDLEERIGQLSSLRDVGSALAARFTSEVRHDDATRVARAIEPERSSPARDIAIAQAILGRFDDTLDIRIGLPIEAKTRALLEEAALALERAWTWVKTRLDRKNWLFVAANLTVAYRLTGRDGQADDLALEVVQYDDTNTDLMERAVVALVRRKDTKAALNLALRLANSPNSTWALLAADVATLAGEWAVVVDWSQKAFAEAKVGSERGRAAERWVTALYRTTGSKSALTEADRLRPSFPQHVGFEATVAEIARRSGDIVAIEASDRRVDTFDVTQLDSLERVELANAYGDRGDWTRAADLLEGLYRLDEPSEPLRQRLLFLHRADLRKEARQFFESLGGECLKSTEIMRLGAAIYEKSGMLREALRCLDVALASGGETLQSRLDWLQLHVRNGDEVVVERWMKRASPDVHGDPDDVLQFARFLDRFGRRAEALNLAYATTKANWANSEALHVHYISLFLMHTQGDPELVRDHVDLESVVTLKSDRGQTVAYRTGGMGEPSYGVLRANSSLVDALLGKKIGDLVSIPDGIGQASIWVVADIKHKYVALFERALEFHDTIFPGSKAIGKFEIDTDAPGGFEPIFEQARTRGRLVDEVVRVYQDGSVPVDAIANIIGLNVIDASRGIRLLSGIPVIACFGTSPEREQATGQLAKAPRILVDALTLGVWQEIGLLNELFADLSICVVQPTLDLLRERVETARSELGQDGGSLEARGEQVLLVPIEKLDRERRLQNCVELLDWCVANTQLVPTEPLTRDLEVSPLLSPDALASVATLAATDMGGVVEDRVLRSLAEALGGRQLGWTQAFLMTRRDAGKISNYDYARYSARLHQSKISFVSISADDLINCIAHGDTETFDILVSTLQVPTVDMESLVNLSAHFIAMVWSDPGHIDRREKLSGALLETLLRKPNGVATMREVVRSVGETLRSRRFPANVVARWWGEYIVGFMKGHFIQ